MDIRQSWLFTKPIAHRGLHNAELPENSIAAFENAIVNGFPVELDVRLIDDGTVVVFHDDKLARMTGQDGYVCNLKQEDLPLLPLKGTSETIPTFEQVLQTVNGRTPLLIEVKNEGKVGLLEKNTLELLKDYKGDFAVQSFNPFTIEYFKDNAPEMTRGILSCFYENSNLSWYKRFALKRLMLNKVAKPQFVAYDRKSLPNKYVTKCGLPTLAWTVRSNTEMEITAPVCDNVIFENFLPVAEETQENN